MAVEHHLLAVHMAAEQFHMQLEARFVELQEGAPPSSLASMKVVELQRHPALSHN